MVFVFLDFRLIHIRDRMRLQKLEQVLGPATQSGVLGPVNMIEGSS